MIAMGFLVRNFVAYVSRCFQLGGPRITAKHAIVICPLKVSMSHVRVDFFSFSFLLFLGVSLVVWLVLVIKLFGGVLVFFDRIVQSIYDAFSLQLFFSFNSSRTLIFCAFKYMCQNNITKTGTEITRKEKVSLYTSSDIQPCI